MLVKVWGIHYNRGRSHSSLVQVSRRFVKKQQMHWTLEGAHLLLQIRTKELNNEMVSAVSHPRKGRSVPPGLEVHS